MRPKDLHPFLELEEPERSRWMADFCASAADSPYESAPFPILRAGEDPATWLIDQYRRALRHESWSPRLELSLERLFPSGIARIARERQPQAVGFLLELAGICGAVSLGQVLRAWIRNRKFRHETFLHGTRSVSIHRRFWELLVAWKQTEGMEHWLLRDFENPDCSALCFAELGRLRPGKAIQRLPATLEWPEPYWREVVRRFLDVQGPAGDLVEDFRLDWKRCLEGLGGDSLLSFEERGGFWMLRWAGIVLQQDESGDRISLYAEEAPERQVQAVVDIAVDWRAIDAAIVGSS